MPQQPSNTKLCQGKWKQRTHDTHQQHLEYFATEKGQNTKVLLLGSSMFERFFTTGKEYFEESFVPRNVGIAGVGGDGVQHMIYRVEQGLLEACPQNLQLIILQSGTNNIEDCNVAQLVTGVTFLVDEIKKRRPDVPIILFGLCPRDSQRKKLTNETLMERIKQVNIELEKIANIKSFVNIFDQFTTNTGERDVSKYDDHVHFNAEGYDLFRQAIVGVIDSNIN